MNQLRFETKERKKKKKKKKEKRRRDLSHLSFQTNQFFSIATEKKMIGRFGKREFV